jgi:ribose transport system ATP-binding protein
VKLQVEDLVKQYPAVRALDGLSLTFEEGDSHAVIGENGAGKSTLMKILAGLEKPTSGRVLINGSPVEIHGARDAASKGIAMVHQELNLVDELSAAENIFLGREPTKGILLSRKAMVQEAEKWLTEVRAPFSADVRVGSLSVAGKQLVEIAKAVSQNAQVLVLDEPTAVLSSRETTALFDLLERIKAQGVTLIYISHLLDEVLSLCRTVTVMRDGRLVETRPTAGSTPAMLASLMVGRDLGDVFPAKSPPPSGDPILQVEGLSVPGHVESLSFHVRPGEILGLAGLVGSGRTEASEALVGLRPLQGKVSVGGEPFRPRGPKDALNHGIAYLTEDRKGAGLVLPMSIIDNSTLATLDRYSKVAVNPQAQKASADSWAQKLDLRAGRMTDPVGSLSGGNQQKVALAKWLDAHPKALILDEPTRGVDVGAKREIYLQIHRLAAEGMACVLISSELPEIVGLCHRVTVMRSGRDVGELEGEDVNEKSIMMLAAGVDQ